MNHLNVEIKARSENPDRIRTILKARKATFKGLDHQTDTYFNCRYGRLKLREGKVENHLIHYHRENQAGPKDSLVTLYRPEPESSLKEVLKNALGVLVVVRKKREIYFIDNVKFHIDVVDELGSFVEIEAIDTAGTLGRDYLYQQCVEYMKLFGIDDEDLISTSYSDMLIKLRGC